MDPQITGILRLCPKLFRDCFTFYILERLYRKLQLSLLVKDFPFYRLTSMFIAAPLVPVLTQINIDPT